MRMLMRKLVTDKNLEFLGICSKPRGTISDRLDRIKMCIEYCSERFGLGFAWFRLGTVQL